MPIIISINCRCGRELRGEVEEGEGQGGKGTILFCDDCYLNHRVEVSEGKPRIVLQYYFPDD